VFQTLVSDTPSLLAAVGLLRVIIFLMISEKKMDVKHRRSQKFRKSINRFIILKINVTNSTVRSQSLDRFIHVVVLSCTSALSVCDLLYGAIDASDVSFISDVLLLEMCGNSLLL
jgi:hypothetical protein